jgi:hypothetical protein
MRPRASAGAGRSPRLVVGAAMVLSALTLAPRERPLTAADEIVAPEAVLGFVPGADRRLADWSQVLDYLNRLAAASPRIRLEEIGRTTQGRPFVLVTVTSEANQARLEEIRRDNARLADPRGLSPEDAERLLARAKVVVAMGYSIHSTEVGGTLTALRLLHQLASAEDAETRAILDATVTLVVPSQNPDGTDLVAEWYRKELGTPFEGTAPPVLYQAYAGHDDNRDWYMFTQQETRATVEHVFRRWHPEIFHDAHQMGTTGARLFVPPYLDPWEPNVDGALIAAANALGAHVATRLTSEGRTGIVTGALFDAWTPSRAYAHTHGGVRLLSETASARIATPIEVKREDLDPRTGGPSWLVPSASFPRPWPGGRWRLADVVSTQLAVSGAVLDHAACNRTHWLRTALAVARRSVERSEPFAFVIPAEQTEPAAAARLLEVLREGEVEIARARSVFDAGGRRFSAGAHVVLMQQPASAFAKTLLERQRYPDLRAGDGKPRRPYDVTAHTLSLLLGVAVEAMPAPFAADLEPVTEPRVAPGRVESGGARLALGHTTADMVALSRLLAQGVRVVWALDRFEDGGRSFAAGTLLVPASARAALEPIARELGIVAHAVRGAPRTLRLRRPRVGVYRSWVPAIDEGWTRFVFDKETAVEYQTLHDREIRGGRLRERFDAIVLPDQPPKTLAEGHAPGSMPPEYVGGLGREGASALRGFVEAGGTLVALDTASLYAIEALRLPARDVLAGLDPAAFYCPGSILEVTVDTSHPLAHGLPSELPIWFEGSPAFEVDPGSVIARYERPDPLLSGWLLGKERLRGHAALAELPLGHGKVILFGFRPQYRAQSRVTYPALLNALYLSAAER